MSLLGWCIEKIAKFYYKGFCFFGKYISAFFTKIFLFISQHIKFFLSALIILICSLLRIQNSKIGLFVACKDYISKNYFHEPCKVVFYYPHVTSTQIKIDKKIEKKKK